MKHTEGPGNEQYIFEGETGEEKLDVQLGLSNGLRLNVVNDDIDDVARFHIRTREEAFQIADALLKLAVKRWPK